MLHSARLGWGGERMIKVVVGGFGVGSKDVYRTGEVLRIESCS